MCGRYSLRASGGKVAPGIDCEIPAVEPRYAMPPSENGKAENGVVVRLNEAGEMYASIAKWGFFPAWMKEELEKEPEKDLLGDIKKEKKKDKKEKVQKKDGWSLARGETVATNGLFRNAFRKNRCLILSDGFFEWFPGTKPKQPYFVHRPDDSVFAMAGIWANRVTKDGVHELNYAMITTEPNDMMKKIHDRMPVILAQGDYRTWLDPETDIDSLTKLLVPCPENYLEAYKVSLYVNNPNHDSPDCLKPL